ncbi:DNA cytosine methyltransferase [Asticcacaulis sp. ZE23SCel15]|uniref:DNA cytosine methyltransferase n=1 Tax=Asticcacaulis sp. ZE23SCel15 TaxID=3059027 RepID=UPI00265DA1DB|nr:DNA cytosine methyltransferase [Asticcacaulis sp. ZE23SCel15]WKL57256.1 DNA cytosine methyltransferase [Asticcacaulis sp. ZE23SCel15]
MNALTFNWPLTATASTKVDFTRALVVDNFAGGGGASTGIEAALGRAIDVAVNHDPAAIAVHRANHPGTEHYCQSVWRADPMDVTKGQPLLLGWFSPDCKHFSKAKGGKPVQKHIRDLAWVVVHWARRLGKDKLKVFMLENVEEFKDWGPLVETDKGYMPCQVRKGEEFERWRKALIKAGATAIEWKEMRACDYGVPTIRKRLFIVIRFDGQPVVWPEPTHGAPESEAVTSGRLQPWKTAADIIDWSIPCPSIFERKVPLKEATCRRIAAGIMRYVIKAKRPFIVPLTHHGSAERLIDLAQPLPTVTGANRGEMALIEPFIVPITHTSNKGAGRSVGDPLATVTTAKGGEFALIAPHVMTMRNAGKPYQGCDEPTHTVTAGGAHQFLVAAFLAQHNGGFYEGDGRSAAEPISTVTGRGTQQQIVTAFMARTAHGDVDKNGKRRGRGFHAIEEPFPTVTSSQDSALVTSHLVKLRGTCADGQATDEPMPTLTAGGLHVGEVRAFLLKYYGNETDGHGLEGPLGTVTTRDRFGLVTVSIEGEEYVIVDIGMRMLTPRELARAQGFPESYILDPVCDYVTDSGATKTGPLPKTHQIAKIGNSVCPDMAAALVRANLPEYCAAPAESEAA